jgi:hypothetical protein
MEALDLAIFSSAAFQRDGVLKAALAHQQSGTLEEMISSLDDIQEHLEHLLSTARSRYATFLLSHLDTIILPAGEAFNSLIASLNGTTTLLQSCHAKELKNDTFFQNQEENDIRTDGTTQDAFLTACRTSSVKEVAETSLLIDGLHDLAASIHRLAYSDALDVMDDMATHLLRDTTPIGDKEKHQFSDVKRKDTYVDLQEKQEKERRRYIANLLEAYKERIQIDMLKQVSHASKKQIIELARVSYRIGNTADILSNFLTYRSTLLSNLFR